MFHPIRSVSLSASLQRGVSLIELMVGMAVGLIVVSGALIVFGTSIRGSSEVLRAARLNQDLATATAIMANELRRAGLTEGERKSMVQETLPSPIPRSIQIPTASCILYQYDQNKNGTIEASEQRGFRLLNGELLMGEGVTSCADIVFDPDDPADPNDRIVDSLTDPSVIAITQLQFDTEDSKCRNIDTTNPTVNGYWRTATQSTRFPCDPAEALSNLRLCSAAGSCATSAPAARTALVADNDKMAEIRRVNIRIVGQLTADPTVEKEMSTSVTIANVMMVRE